jgi:hypothetical protein
VLKNLDADYHEYLYHNLGEELYKSKVVNFTDITTNKLSHQSKKYAYLVKISVNSDETKG